MVRFLNDPSREASWGAQDEQLSVVVVGALDGSKVLIRLLDLVPCMRQDGVVSLRGVVLRELTCPCIKQPHLRDYRGRSIVGMGRVRE